MISVEEARARILAHFAPLPAQDSLLEDALGQVLAADVRAGFNIPLMSPDSAVAGRVWAA